MPRSVTLRYPTALVIATRWGSCLARRPSPAAGPSLRAAVDENLQTLGADRLHLVYLRIGKIDAPTAGPSPSAHQGAENCVGKILLSQHQRR